MKKVVDEVACWLRAYDDGSVDRSWTGPPELEFMLRSVPPHDDFVDGVATHDLTVDPATGLAVRVYVPQVLEEEERSSKVPIILHFHGGGFCISRADWYMYYAVYTRLARQASAVVVSVYLRLAPEHRLPAACDDGYNALLWVASLAQSAQSSSGSDPAAISWLRPERLDFQRIFLIGDSSGGNIVHQVAARASQEPSLTSPIKVAGCIPIHPGFVRSTRSKSESELQNESPMLTLEMVDRFLSLALPVGTTKDHPITCPMGPLAPPLDAVPLPPFLVAVPENDLIRDTEMEYCEALKNAGKDVQVVFSPGVGHSFYLNKAAVDTDVQTRTQTDVLFAVIVNFINKRQLRA